MKSANDPTLEQDRKPLTTEEAKLNFANAMREFDLLEPLRKHPYLTVGAAATAGAVLGGSGKAIGGLAALTSSLVKLVKPLSGIVAQVVAAKVAAQTAASEAADNPPPEPSQATSDPTL